MRKAGKLTLQGAVKAGMPVAVEVGPNGRIAVNVPIPLGIPHPRSLSLYNADGVAGAPVLHLCERMPHMSPVPVQGGSMKERQGFHAGEFVFDGHHTRVLAYAQSGKKRAGLKNLRLSNSNRADLAVSLRPS